MIYQVLVSLAFKLEQKVSAFIREQLHGRTSPCPLRIKNLSSVLKASKGSGQLLLRNSYDPFVSSCVPKHQTGSWKVEDTYCLVM